MGCDIHIVVEQRAGLLPTDPWVAVSIPQLMAVRDGSGNALPIVMERNYVRFAALAGVRGKGPSPRGLPADMSDTTAWLVKKCGLDGHSHSWLPLADAARIWLETEYKAPEPESFAVKCPEWFFFKIDQEPEPPWIDSRVVFWFDN